MNRRTLALCTLFAASNLLLGCEDETTTDEGVTVDPPTMELTSPAEGACVAIGSEINSRVSFVLKTSWLYLRAPGICGEAVQCGQLVLSIDGDQVTRAATNVIEWDVASVPNRYGQFEARIEALKDSGEPIEDAAGEPLVATRSFTTAVSCPAEP